jgi:hypothetical protein
MFSVLTKATEETPAGRIDITVGDALEFGMTFTLKLFTSESLGTGIERWSENPAKMDVLEISGSDWDSWQDKNDYDYVAGLAAAKMGLEKVDE